MGGADEESTAERSSGLLVRDGHAATSSAPRFTTSATDGLAVGSIVSIQSIRPLSSSE
jgi:hypothetical protein